MTVVVPDLREKLTALRELGQPGPSRTEILGELAIASDSTLRWYESGSATRTAGRVPEAVFAALVRLFTSRLPGHRDEAEVASLLAGTATAVRSAFLSGSDVIWWHLVERAAARTGGRLVREADVEFGLVEIEGVDGNGGTATRPSNSTSRSASPSPCRCRATT